MVSAPVAVIENARGESVQDRADPAQSTAPVYLPIMVQYVDQTDELTPWWTPFRDIDLRRFWKRDGNFASAMYNIQAVTSTTGYVVEGEKPNVVKRATAILDNAEFGQGFKVMLKKLCEDWLTQDNGMFMEIIGPGTKSSPLTAPPVGIAHLDAGRCWRSGEPETPVWYQHPHSNEWLKLHWTRVAFQAANPSPLEAARGVGFCAVSRAASIMATMRDTVRYKLEKISGRHTRGFVTFSGAPLGVIELAIAKAGRVADNAGNTKFSAMPIVGSPTEGTEVNAQVVELAGVPDGFDWQTELTMYMYIIALALGVDARELWPATQTGATKADAEIQHRKAMRKGMGDFLTTIEYIINHRVFPVGVTFEFKPADSEEDQVQATIEEKRVNTVKAMADTGIVTARGAALYLVNAGVLPPEYLENPDLSPAALEKVEGESESAVADEIEKPEGEQPTGEPQTEDEGGKAAFRFPFGDRFNAWWQTRQRKNLWRRIDPRSEPPPAGFGLASLTMDSSLTPSTRRSGSD